MTIQRPFGVTLIAVFMLLLGIARTVLIVFLVIGLLGLLMSYGMFTLKGWARAWTIFVATLNLLGPITGFLFRNQRLGLDAVISVIVFAVVLYYLSTTPVKRAFGKA